jgi:hypothetical protein
VAAGQLHTPALLWLMLLKYGVHHGCHNNLNTTRRGQVIGTAATPATTTCHAKGAAHAGQARPRPAACKQTKHSGLRLLEMRRHNRHSCPRSHACGGVDCGAPAPLLLLRQGTLEGVPLKRHYVQHRLSRYSMGGCAWRLPAGRTSLATAA